MKTTDTFTYKSQYAEYPNCHFAVYRYATNGNLAIQIEDDDGLVCTCSTNTDVKLPDDSIGIKNYSENEGMDDFLVDIGIVERKISGEIKSGYVSIPVMKLTESGRELFESVLTAPF